MTALNNLLHAVVANDVQRVAQLLRAEGKSVVNDLDESGQTPLMVAAAGRDPGVEVLQALIDAGAELDAVSTAMLDQGRTALSYALSACDIRKARLLIDAGADLHYNRNECSAMMDAAYGAGGRPSDEVVPLLNLLAERGARLDDSTCHGESAIRVLSNNGQFEGVRALLEAGADPAPLAWTPLHRAIALGSLSEVNAALDAGEDAEARDSWERTPLLLAIQVGDQHKVELLLLHGVNREARGRCGKPAVFHAIETRNAAMLTWLLDEGFPLYATDDFGTSALACACEHGNFDAVRKLLDAGMDPDQHDDHRNALYCCEDPAIARALLDGGADPRQLPFEMRRALVRLPAEPSIRLFDATAEEFLHGAHRRFGSSNPERMVIPFWHAMLRSGVDAWCAPHHFERHPERHEAAVWCARRFGQSITFLADGRVIQIAGEHEDWYDPDFCIYNDVFVHHPDGCFEIYGYPEAVFPPTDFHTATLAGDTIYVIGSLGYDHQRTPGTTPVFALDTRTLRISRVDTRGENPGWIHRHRAILAPGNRIRLFGGRVEHEAGSGSCTINRDAFELDLERHVWTRVINDPEFPNPVPGHG